MSIYCIINNNVVTSLVDISAGGTLPAGVQLVVPNDTAKVGWYFDPKTGAFTDPNSPNAMPIIVVDMWKAKAVLKSTPYDPTTAQASVQPVLTGVTNLLAATDALINASGNNLLLAYWENANSIQSNDKNLLALASQLNLTSIQIQNLFTQAESLSI